MVNSKKESDKWVVFYSTNGAIQKLENEGLGVYASSVEQQGIITIQFVTKTMYVEECFVVSLIQIGRFTFSIRMPGGILISVSVKFVTQLFMIGMDVFVRFVRKLDIRNRVKDMI